MFFLLWLNIHPSPQCLRFRKCSQCCGGSAAPPFPCAGLGQEQGPAEPVQRALSHSRESASFSTHFMVWSGIITAWSVRKRIYLVCLFLLCVSMGDRMTFPSQCVLLWPIQDISDPFWVTSLDEQVWTSPVWLNNHLSLRERNIMVLCFCPLQFWLLPPSST